MSNKEKFMQELMNDCDSYLRLARKNYYLASTLIIVSIISSFLTAISISNSGTILTDFQLALLAAIPGTVLTFNSKLKNEEKSKWYYSRFHRLNSVRREFEFNGLSLEMAVAEVNKIIDDTENQYPGLGSGDESS